MKRLTTDNPSSNFETMLNFVYGKDGFAHIRDDGEKSDVPLTSWAKAQCLYRGCDDFPAETPEEIDEILCDCVMDCPECPIALAYCFASQAVHLRSRLKMYEDILFDSDGRELVTLEQLKELAVSASDAPLTLEELQKMDGEPVWINSVFGRMYALVEVSMEESGRVYLHTVNGHRRMSQLEFTAWAKVGGFAVYRRKLK